MPGTRPAAAALLRWETPWPGAIVPSLRSGGLRPYDHGRASANPQNPSDTLAAPLCIALSILVLPAGAVASMSSCLRIDTNPSPASTAPPLTPESTAPPSNALAMIPGELSSPIAMGGKDELAYTPAYTPFPDVPPLLSHSHSHASHSGRTPHSPSIPLPPSHPPPSIPHPDPSLRSTPTAELGPFEYPVPAPDSEAGRRAAHGAPEMQEYMSAPSLPPSFPAEMRDGSYSSQGSMSSSLPEDIPIRNMPAATEGARKGHARSPSGGHTHGHALPRLAPSNPRRGSTIAFAHTPLHAPIPPSLLRRQSAHAAAPTPRPSVSPKSGRPPCVAEDELPPAEDRAQVPPVRPSIRPRPTLREKSLSQ
jgi:hypothetical protein